MHLSLKDSISQMTKVIESHSCFRPVLVAERSSTQEDGQDRRQGKPNEAHHL